MSGFLLDTNVVSEFNRRGDPARWSNSGWRRPKRDLFTRVSPPSQKFDLESNFFLRANGARSWRNGSIGTCLHGSAAGFYRLINRLRIDGECFAATALQHSLTIVSRNVSDFAVVGVAVVNPREAQPSAGRKLAALS